MNLNVENFSPTKKIFRLLDAHLDKFPMKNIKCLSLKENLYKEEEEFTELIKFLNVRRINTLYL